MPQNPQVAVHPRFVGGRKVVPVGAGEVDGAAMQREETVIDGEFNGGCVGRVGEAPVIGGPTQSQPALQCDGTDGVVGSVIIETDQIAGIAGGFDVGILQLAEIKGELVKPCGGTGGRIPPADGGQRGICRHSRRQGIGEEADSEEDVWLCFMISR